MKKLDYFEVNLEMCSVITYNAADITFKQLKSQSNPAGSQSGD